MKNRLWLGLTSLITYLCLEALTLFGLGILTDQNIYLLFMDTRFILVSILLALVIVFWMTNVFLGSRRTIKNRRKRSWQYKKANWIMTGAAFMLVPITHLCSMAYTDYLDYPGLRSYEKAISKSFQTGYLNGLDTLSRHGTWKGDVIVAHAMGGINSHSYTLSKEAYELNFGKGFRVFELDFITTSDGDIALRHYWGKKRNGKYDVYSTEKFKKEKYVGAYTPLLLKDFLEYMKSEKDLWVVTDSKENAESIFKEVVKEAKEMHAEKVLDRFIIQFFDAEMYETVNSIYPFKNYIYGTYKYWVGNENEFEDICRFCVENQIDSISMWNYYCNEKIISMAHRYNLDVYVHTENSLSAAYRYLDMGVKGVYTDFIEPAQLGDYE